MCGGEIWVVPGSTAPSDRGVQRLRRRTAVHGERVWFGGGGSVRMEVLRPRTRGRGAASSAVGARGDGVGTECGCYEHAWLLTVTAGLVHGVRATELFTLMCLMTTLSECELGLK
jgi:hypothetical protein